MRGQWKFAKRLLENDSVDVNFKGHGGKTPLMVVGSLCVDDYLCSDMYNLLLQKGADLDTIDDNGKSLRFNNMLLFYKLCTSNSKNHVNDIFYY